MRGFAKPPRYNEGGLTEIGRPSGRPGGNAIGPDEHNLCAERVCRVLCDIVDATAPAAKSAISDTSDLRSSRKPRPFADAV